MERVFLCILIAMRGMAGMGFPAEHSPGSGDGVLSYELDPVIITFPPMQESLEVSFNPKAPQQRLLAQDGAACLKEPVGVWGSVI